jgi:hypothetical protein
MLDRVSPHPASRIEALLPELWEAFRRGHDGATPAQEVEAPADSPGLRAEPQGQQFGIREGP